MPGGPPTDVCLRSRLNDALSGDLSVLLHAATAGNKRAGERARRIATWQPLPKSLCCGEDRPEPPPPPPLNISRLEQDGSDDSDPLLASEDEEDEEDEPPLPRPPERSEASNTEYFAAGGTVAAVGAAAWGGRYASSRHLVGLSRWML